MAAEAIISAAVQIRDGTTELFIIKCFYECDCEMTIKSYKWIEMWCTHCNQIIPKYHKSYRCDQCKRHLCVKCVMSKLDHQTNQNEDESDHAAVDFSETEDNNQMQRPSVTKQNSSVNYSVYIQY